MKTEENGSNNESSLYQLCVAKKLNSEVTQELMKVFEELELSSDDFDERAIEALGAFSADQAKYIIGEVKVGDRCVC